MSAQLSWSSKSSSMGFSWSRLGSAARWAATASSSSAKRPSASALASTTVTTPSTVTRDLISGQLKARTSGWGRARPEVSITMCWGGSARSSSFLMVGTKSSATVQQMQPLASSITSSSRQVSTPQPRRISPSTPTSPNSLMMRAMRRPLAFSSMLRISVVLPAPRKPVMTVAGIFSVLMWRRCPWRCG